MPRCPDRVRELDPLPDGSCPRLLPGQCCQTEGLWHFKDPDGNVFAAGSAKCRVVRSKGGLITLVPAAPPFACAPDGNVVPNPWTVTGGDWRRDRD